VIGSVIGGSGASSGNAQVNGTFKNAIVKGSIIGGADTSAGLVSFNGSGNVTIVGDLVGGSADRTGLLACAASKKVTITGSIIGGVQENSGTEDAGVLFGSQLGAVTVGGDIVAGRTIGGSGSVYHGAIHAFSIASVTIRGSLIGNELQRVFILGQGSTPAISGDFNAIGKVTIKGHAHHAYIAAGHSADLNDSVGLLENADAGIGSIFIGGSVFHTNISAGINDVNSTGLTDADTISLGDPNRTAVIGSVVIKGTFLNDASAGVCGIGAQRLNKVTIGGVVVFLAGDATYHPNDSGNSDIFDFTG
jgi:hypothetical protein